MRAVGIIAEYNPFHNGHLLHLEEAKKLAEGDPIVLILSGDFTQRGDVSILDKWEKTEIALAFGVDLVIELPYPFATQSADVFAKGAITLLDLLQVDQIVFGSELNDIGYLQQIALVQKEEDFQQEVKHYLESGINYPTALSKALMHRLGFTAKQPNDLLGISYLKTIDFLHSNMKAHAIARQGSYHDQSLNGSISSATAIRKSLLAGEEIVSTVPSIVYEIVKDRSRSMADFFSLLRYKILTEEDLSVYQDVDEGLEHRMKKVILEVSNYQEFIEGIKTKRYTYNKISRMCCHILCNFTKEKAIRWREIEYIRVLGFSSKGQQYLNQIKKELSVPLVTKFKKEQSSMLDYEVVISAIYSTLVKNQSEYSRKETKQAPIRRK